MRIGAHVSASGGVSKAVGRAVEMGAECIQIFTRAPQSWKEIHHSDEEVQGFASGIAQQGMGPGFVHGIYLMNLASSNPEIRAKSLAALKEQLYWSARLKCDGLVIHPGSAGQEPYPEAEARICEALVQTLADAPAGARILLETCAGQGTTVGRRFEELASIIECLGSDERLLVCFDTAHVYAAGYDLKSDGGVERTLEELDRVVGLSRLALVHANDSKAALGSNVDRHENIGLGHLGEEPFKRLLAHPALAEMPLVLEVPGFAGTGPDKENIDILRRLAGR